MRGVRLALGRGEASGIEGLTEKSISPAASFTIALAGQPNVGKSTIFNLLTGQSQYVSNWPGKTCEQKTALVHRDGQSVYLIDLPGVYSLTADFEEERIA